MSCRICRAADGQLEIRSEISTMLMGDVSKTIEDLIQRLLEALL